MSSEVVIRARDLGKCYHVYKQPHDRLKQLVNPGIRTLLGLNRRQYFDEFWALRDVSFEIHRGETVGIVGRNGSGKSTLLQLICGTLTPTTGVVEKRGRVAALLELGSGFNPEFTGRENVFLNGAIHGFSRKAMEERFERIAAFADIGDFIDQPVKTYSSGMYARLAFSASIFVDPDVLIIDEILAVGDAPFQAKCMKAFHKLRDDGCTILIVSHDSYMIKNFCQRGIYLRKGALVGCGESHDIVDQYSIEVERALATGANGGRDAAAAGEGVPGQAFESTGAGIFRISDVGLLGPDGQPTSSVRTGEDVTIRFSYRALAACPPKVTFVANLYRHDGFYICGTTSLLDSHEPFEPGSEGEVRLTFPNLPLLAGQYVWRVAINDEKAFGVYAEANLVCPFEVKDRLEAVGLVQLERRWSVVNDASVR